MWKLPVQTQKEKLADIAVSRALSRSRRQLWNDLKEDTDVCLDRSVHSIGALKGFCSFIRIFVLSVAPPTAPQGEHWLVLTCSQPSFLQPLQTLLFPSDILDSFTFSSIPFTSDFTYCHFSFPPFCPPALRSSVLLSTAHLTSRLTLIIIFTLVRRGAEGMRIFSQEMSSAPTNTHTHIARFFICRFLIATNLLYV